MAPMDQFRNINPVCRLIHSDSVKKLLRKEFQSCHSLREPEGRYTIHSARSKKQCQPQPLL
jgi:hypothetical protein